MMVWCELEYAFSLCWGYCSPPPTPPAPPPHTQQPLSPPPLQRILPEQRLLEDEAQSEMVLAYLPNDASESPVEGARGS